MPSHAAAAPEAHPERRAEPRYQPHAPTTGRAYVGDDERPVPARLLDLSGGGVGLLLGRPVPVGAALCLEVGGAEAAPARLVSTVVNVAEQPGGWRCGCKLLWKGFGHCPGGAGG